MTCLDPGRSDNHRERHIVLYYSILNEFFQKLKKKSL